MLLFLCALILGMINGILSGLFGLGGGILVVPIISSYITFIGLPQYSMNIAVSTSLCSIIITLSLSSFGHYKAGNLPLKTALKLLIPSILGAILGGFLNVSPHFSRLVFGIFLMIAAVQMFWSSSNSKNQQTENRIKPTNFKIILAMLVAFILAILSTIIGVGGGSLLVPILLALGWNIRHVIATSAFLGSAIGFCATAIKIIKFPALNIQQELINHHQLYLWGNIHLIWLSGLVIGAIMTNKRGIRLSNELPILKLKRYFTFLLLTISGYMIYKSC